MIIIILFLNELFIDPTANFSWVLEGQKMLYTVQQLYVLAPFISDIQSTSQNILKELDHSFASSVFLYFNLQL